MRCRDALLASRPYRLQVGRLPRYFDCGRSRWAPAHCSRTSHCWRTMSRVALACAFLFAPAKVGAQAARSLKGNCSVDSLALSVLPFCLDRLAGRLRLGQRNLTCGGRVGFAGDGPALRSSGLAPGHCHSADASSTVGSSKVRPVSAVSRLGHAGAGRVCRDTRPADLAAVEGAIGLTRLYVRPSTIGLAMRAALRSSYRGDDCWERYGRCDGELHGPDDSCSAAVALVG